MVDITLAQNKARHTLDRVIVHVIKELTDPVLSKEENNILCNDMIKSLEAWPDQNFVQSALAAFKRGNASEGIKLTRECLHFHLPFSI